MSNIYFPGCKYTALSPEVSSKIKTYLHDKLGMVVTGCCRTNYKILTEQDTALVVCPTCLFNLQETAPNSNIKTIWEVLAECDQFHWPNYQGEKMTVQDCKDTHNNPNLQNAIRKILNRMNVNIVEIEKSFEKADDFCNISSSHTEERIKEHCKSFTTDVIVCYCTGCFNALNIAGVHGIHLMGLIMGDYE